MHPRSLLLGIVIVGCLTTIPAAAQDRISCEDLFRQKIDNVSLFSSASVPAQGDLPAYCRVLGVVRPAINFEVRLPFINWNGKFYMTGCGGFCGTLNTDATNFPNINLGLRRNYAVSTMDSGHWGSSTSDGRWAFNNRVAEADWGWRAVNETTRATKLLIKFFYGKEPDKSYFAGCSTGGRMAAMEAQRFPDDFNGIISGSPSLNSTGLTGTWNA